MTAITAILHADADEAEDLPQIHQTGIVVGIFTIIAVVAWGATTGLMALLMS